MLIKMLTAYSGQKGTCSPGKCIDLPPAEAKRFLDKGLADKPSKLESAIYREETGKAVASEKE